MEGERRDSDLYVKVQDADSALASPGLYPHNPAATSSHSVHKVLPVAERDTRPSLAGAGARKDHFGAADCDLMRAEDDGDVVVDDETEFTNVMFHHQEVMSPTSSSSNGSNSDAYSGSRHPKRHIQSSESTSPATESDSDDGGDVTADDPDAIKMRIEHDEDGDAVEIVRHRSIRGDDAEEDSRDRFKLAIDLDFETDTTAVGPSSVGAGSSGGGPQSASRKFSSSFSDLGDYDNVSMADVISAGGGSGSTGGTPTTFYPIYEHEAFRFAPTAALPTCGSYNGYDLVERNSSFYSPEKAFASRNIGSDSQSSTPTTARWIPASEGSPLDLGGRLTPTSFLLSEPTDESQPLVGSIYPVSGEVVRMRVENAAYIIFYKQDESAAAAGSGSGEGSEFMVSSSSSDDAAGYGSNEIGEDGCVGTGRAPPRSYASLGAAGHKVQAGNAFARDYSHPTRSIGRGLFRASTSVGSAFLKGAAGLVNKTYQGGASGGVFGFAKGLGMGMLGLGTHAVKGAVRGVGQVTNLVGEMVLGTAPHFSIDGTLVLTNYRVIWMSQSTKDAMEIPVGSLVSAESSTTAPHVASLECKHLLRASIAFQDERTCSQFLNCIWELYSGTPHYSFAHVHYQALVEKHSNSAVETPTDEFYNAEDDYRRLRLLDEESWMRLYDNSDYTLFPSYPDAFVVPSELDDEDLRELSAYRSASRIPAIVWRHPHTGALVSRCAQPCAGLSGYVVEADQKLVAALQRATGGNYLYGDSRFHFFDARSQMAATANAAQGKGTEDPRNYPNAELHFCDIANIHAVRSSYASLSMVCQPGQERYSDEWLFQLRNTFWFLHVSRILASAQDICRCLCQGESVMIHCSDGWDRTSQLSAMVQLLLDPFYRTLRGLLLLVEKEWCTFGHMFRARFAQGDGPGQQEMEEMSPVFIQFLDALWQVWRQQPWAFEFNEVLLAELYEHVFSGRYGTFLYNNERERKQREASSPTRSLWAALLADKDEYVNVEYDSAKNFNSIGLVLPFSSEEDDLVMWENHLVYADPVCRKYE